MARQTLASAATSGATIIQPNKSLFDLDLRAVWRSRELWYFLAWRDVKVRYKQTAIGAGWAIIQPLLTIMIFTLIFGQFARIPSEGLPYSVFALAALLPWNFFAHATARGATSLISNTSLITKIYFPRVVIPIASMALPAVDFAVSLFTLIALMAWYRITPTWGLLTLPLFVVFAAFTALTVSLFLSPINVRYRDVGYAVPFLLQLWMYASPVVYPVSLVPERWRMLYSLNPLVGIIEGFRWALLGSRTPDLTALTISAPVVLCLFLVGLVHFKRMERTFADVI